MYKWIIILVLAIAFLSCTEEPDYPVIPEIKYESFLLYQDLDSYSDTILIGELKFTVLDGDGDVGYRDNDTIPPLDTSKVYLKMFEKVNGTYQVIMSEDTLKYRIPYLTSAGKSKSLKAEIIIKFEYYNEPALYDTLKYDFYIVDRSFNKSNIESTPDIAF